ncbi:phage tail protein [Agrobacterium tumefaciens]|uniref:D-alanyl-D-alanine carboxypeptidase family protein n=2 Tax=Agrobacterium tumefaciens TaxID=358 RepID=UPI0015727D8C|nr:phage tail protein [Agrobacterium tumefaciens]NSZ37848.1 phage tail protein [Agrobacterium tumefaciens]NTB22051.1 phage tail protein [Agrobacterium tumefaciens]NTB28896.1 phage tail protein [Agrobacterium tumefaciens]NTB36543.1 phage tail protein [Agrobacterium tumefaciens]
MADEGQQLLVTLAARFDKYERDMERQKQRSRTGFKQMQSDAEKAGSGIEKAMGNAMKTVGAFGKGLAGGIIGGLAIGGLDAIIGRVADITKGIASIGSEAKRAGLSNRAFQELAYVAEQARIPVDALTDGMKELSLRADEFIYTGKGSAAEAFQRLGFSASDLKEKLKDPSALLVEIIGRLQQLDRAAQIRIADELFGGTGGERFVELLSRGADGIRETIAEAHKLGAVMSDEMIARADELDRKFNKIGTTVSTFTKQAVVGLVGAMDDFLDRWNRIEEQSNRNVQRGLTAVYEDLQEAKAVLADLQSQALLDPDDPITGQNIDRQKQKIEELTTEAMRLRDVLDRRNGYSENFIYRAGQEAAGAKPPITDLNNAMSGTDSAAAKATANIKSFADAIRSLKGEVPELAKELQNLDAKARIEAVYQKSLSMAQGQREIALANEMRGKALASVNLKSATDDPASYLSSVLASGKNASHVTGLQADFQKRLATMIASMPKELGSVTINSGFRSVQRQQELWLQALRKYGSPEAARRWVAPPGRSNHNKGLAADLGYSSDDARQWIHQNAGNYGLSFPLKNENWHVEDSSARSKDTAAEIDRLTQAATRQSEVYSQITAGAREYTDAQRTEQQALGMTEQAAAALRYEQQMLAEAQRAGIALSPQQRSEIAQLAAGMAAAETSTEALRLKQEQLSEAGNFFGGQMVDALSGIITGTTTWQQALQGILQSLVKVGLQAALLGTGPLAGLFDGSGGSSSGGMGGILGGLLASLFGFSEGGWTGPGSKHQPAGVVHADEFVFSKQATRALGVRNLEAMHQAAKRGYAEGGLVTETPSLSAGFSGGVSASQTQNISIAPTITVNGSAGTPEQNADLAKQISREFEGTVRGLIAKEVQAQSRPGNFLNSRSR